MKMNKWNTQGLQGMHTLGAGGNRTHQRRKSNMLKGCVDCFPDKGCIWFGVSFSISLIIKPLNAFNLPLDFLTEASPSAKEGNELGKRTNMSIKPSTSYILQVCNLHQICAATALKSARTSWDFRRICSSATSLHAVLTCAERTRRQRCRVFPVGELLRVSCC